MEAISEALNSTGPAQLLFASIWQGLLLTACVWVALKLAAALGLSLRAATRFSLWLSVFLLVALLPCLALLRSAFTTHYFALPANPAAQFSLHLPPYWAFAFEALWAVSSLFCLARLLVSGQHMRTLFQHSEPVTVDDLEPGLQALVARPGQRRVEIRLSDAVDTPSAIGFFHPAVVVPRSLWCELSPAELRQIVLHELAHLERGDDWTNLLQKLLRALCPLNPALLWAERHLCQERERACDDAVLDHAGNARAYAGCLTKLAESRLVRRAASLAPGLWKRPSELAARVDNILHRRRTLGPLLSRGLLAASLLASVTGALLLQCCPNLIAFTGNQPLAATVAVADLAPTTIERVQFKPSEDTAVPQASYHDAVFHPAVNNPPVAQAKHAGTKRISRLRRTQPFYASSVRWVNAGYTQDGREVFTLVVFTVELPQNTRMLPLADVTTLSLSDNWIAFQI